MEDKYYPGYDDNNFNNIVNKYEFQEKDKHNFVYQDPRQLVLRNIISKNTIYDNMLLYHMTGSGKCHGIDTPILMFDGTIKKVQDIKVGELLMGDDSRKRKVISLARGKDMMYDIIPVKGEKYTVNKEHIICLKVNGYPSFNMCNENYNIEWVENNKFQSKTFTFTECNKKIKKTESELFLKSIKCEQIIEIAIKDYLKLSNEKKHMMKGYKVPINFSEKHLDIEPYIIGTWLSSDSIKIQENTLNKYNLINNKHIPMIYKCNSRENRLKLLAGLIDSDGSLTTCKLGYEFSQSLEHEQLIDDIVYLCRSLGFECNKNLDVGETLKICIYGKGLSEIPCIKNTNIRIQKKDVLVYSITVEELYKDDYYGFILDGNSRYVMGDFTVTHNSCSSITIAEGFKEYVLNMGRKILVLVKNGNIEKNFKNELLSDCSNNEYITRQQSEFLKISKDQVAKKELMNKITRKINKVYNFMTYGTFVNQVLGMKEFEKDSFGRNTSKQKKNKDGIYIRKRPTNAIIDVNNTVIIIDEAHNVTNNDVYIALMNILNKSYNYRLLLLTATPMYDNPKEIIEISNLLNANNINNILPIRNNLFKSIDGKEPLMKKQNSKYLGDSILKSGLTSITEYGIQQLVKNMKGKVSYLQANTDTFPTKIDMGEALLNKIGSVKIVPCYMSTYQYNIYKNALKLDSNENNITELDELNEELDNQEFDNQEFDNQELDNEELDNQEFDNQELDNQELDNEELDNQELDNQELDNQEFDNQEFNTSKNLLSKSSSLYKNSSDASTMTYPNNMYGKQGFLSSFKEVNKSGEFKVEIDRSFLEYDNDLKKYSSKLFNLLTNIKNSPGNVFIYSNYVNYGGTSLVKQLLLANGYKQYKSRKDNQELSFILYDDSTNVEAREKQRRIFNSNENADGKYIKIIIGSPVISEGITLKNVRQVHILEPAWNMSRINQIIGRGIRHYSHHFLTESERNVQVYKYCSMYKDNKILFIDKEKYILAEEKDRSNKVIERVLKTIAFDCNINNNVDNIDGTPECDYTTCKYNCLIRHGSGVNKTMDKFTYNMYINFFEEYDIEINMSFIKDLFKKYFVWSISDIITKIKELEPIISTESIYTALKEMIENKTIILDNYEREGFLLQKSEYIIFNPVDIDINSSIYSKMLDFNVDSNKYNLTDYVKIKLNENLITESVKEKKEKKKLDTVILSDLDLKYNKKIMKNKLYGSYRERATKESGGIFGIIDNKFRIIDLRESELSDDDKRKNISGMVAKSYNKKQLIDILTYLKIDNKEIQQYLGYPNEIVIKTLSIEQLVDIIQKHLDKNKLILK